MSRGDFGARGGGHGESSGFSSVPSTGVYAKNGDTEYVRLSNSISNNIQQLTKSTAAIQGMVNKIGTSRDVPELYEQLVREQKVSNKLASETSMYLKQLSRLEAASPQESRQRKIQQEKLQDNFSNVLTNFQRVQRLAAEKEKASVQRARVASVSRGVSEQEYEHGETSPIRKAGAPQLQVQTEAELSLDMIREREEGIRQLEADIVNVNEIFKDLAIMVHEQGDTIDSIESNVESAAAHVETGNVQLEKASGYQRAARKKTCCILITLVVVAGIIALVVYFSVKK